MTRLATLLGSLAVLALAATPLSAHPGIGIVVDSRGNVFYTDLKQVWRIAPDGTRSVAVPGVHTHELYLDAQDNLFGQHLWYEGEASVVTVPSGAMRRRRPPSIACTTPSGVAAIQRTSSNCAAAPTPSARPTAPPARSISVPSGASLRIDARSEASPSPSPAQYMFPARSRTKL